MPNRFTAALDALSPWRGWHSYIDVDSISPILGNITDAFAFYIRKEPEVMLAGSRADVVQLFFAFLAEIDDEMIDVLHTESIFNE